MILTTYEDSIYRDSYLKKIKEEIKFHYHAYNVRTIFKLDGKIVKCTFSPLCINNCFPSTFIIKGNTFESLWNFIDNSPNQLIFIGASRWIPDKFHKQKRIVFNFSDYSTKPWKETEKHTWEFIREIFIEFPTIKQLEESNESIEKIIPYINERMGW